MKKIYAFVLLLAAIVMTTAVNAQVINGDLNHNQGLDVEDVTLLIDGYLTGKSEQIQTGGAPFAVDNSFVVGKWYKSKNESMTLNEDGTTDFGDGYTYKFLSTQGYLLFYNASNAPVYALRVLDVAYGYMVVLPAGSNTPVTYSSNYNNGYEYVDLGLSVKWATMNVGANTPEGYGDYFAWGETTPKSEYNWVTYKWSGDTRTSLVKYIAKEGDDSGVEGFTMLEPSDDAARVKWGGTWRMPTYDELVELGECKWESTTQNNVNGYKITGPNGNSIFLPKAGWRNDKTLVNQGSYVTIWSSSLYTRVSYQAWQTSGKGYVVPVERCGGRSVRAVCP